MKIIIQVLTILAPTLLSLSTFGQSSSHLSIGLINGIQKTKMEDYNSTLKFFGNYFGQSYKPVKSVYNIGGYITYQHKKLPQWAISIYYNTFWVTREDVFKTAVTDIDGNPAGTVDTETEFLSELSSISLIPTYLVSIKEIHQLKVSAGISLNNCNVTHTYYYGESDNPNIDFPDKQVYEWEGTNKIGFVGSVGIEVWKNKKLTPELAFGYRYAAIQDVTRKGTNNLTPSFNQDFSGIFGNIGVRYKLF